MTSGDIEKIRILINTPAKIVITTHANPDGDAMGSSLALYNYLIQKKHDVTVITPTAYPEFLHWMPGHEKVLIFTESVKKAEVAFHDAEVMFCLDYNTPSRVDKMQPLVESFKGISILIDHHPEPADFTDFRLSVTKASSTAELIYEFICLLNNRELITRKVAECIYTGILTDTGSFTYNSTSVRAHEVAGDMISAGADNQKIQSFIFQNNSLNGIRLLGYSLSEKLRVLQDFNTGYITLSIQELEKFKYKQGDTEGLVNYATSIKGIRFAALLTERKDRIKLSFRSTGKFPTNKVAKDHFNGGGHINASGGEYFGTLEEAEKLFVSILPEYRRELIG